MHVWDWLMIIKAMLELIKYLADKGNLLCIGYAVLQTMQRLRCLKNLHPFTFETLFWVTVMRVLLIMSHSLIRSLSLGHSLQKSSANHLSLSIYKLTGYRSVHNQPITAKLSKIPLYWHSWLNWNSYILANEIACLITDLWTSFKHPSPHKQSRTFHGKLCHG